MVIFGSLVWHADSSRDTIHIQAHLDPTWRWPLLHGVHIPPKRRGYLPFFGGPLRHGGDGHYFDPYDVIQSVELVEIEAVLSYFRKWDGPYIESVSQVQSNLLFVSRHYSSAHGLFAYPSFSSSIVTVQLCYLGMLLSSLSDIVVVSVGMFQAVFHNIMICRVFRMMKLDSGTSLDTMHTYLTPIAFDLNGPHSQNSSLTSDNTLVSW